MQQLLLLNKLLEELVSAQQLADRFGLPRGWAGRGLLAISGKNNITLEQFTLWLADRIKSTVCEDFLVWFVKVCGSRRLDPLGLESILCSRLKEQGGRHKDTELPRMHARTCEPVGESDEK